MPELPAPKVRFWVEFVDPDPDANHGAPVVYRCDLTWLTSRWQCIFGAGCPGIYSDRPDDGCCSLGAHFSDHADQERVERMARELTSAQWQNRDVARGPRRRLAVTTKDDAGDPKTALIDGTCVFLNRPGFRGGSGCALHLLARQTGRSVVETKPEVCWQLPLRRTFEDVTGPDEVVTQLITIGEYDRRGWGPGGHDLDWYCTTASEAHTAATPLYVRAEAELVALMGRAAYEELSRHAQSYLGVQDGMDSRGG